MSAYTKRAAEVFAPTTAGGAPRGADMGEAQTWGTEVERAIDEGAGDVDAKVEAERLAREQAIADEIAARESGDQNLSDRIDLVEGGVAVTYETRAQLFADLAHPADSIAHVYGDSNEAYRGVYKKSGGSGSGSWTRIGPLPMITNAASSSVSGLMTPEMFNNLARAHIGRGPLASNADLNTILLPGVYFGDNLFAGTGKPSDFPAGAFIFVVEAYGLGTAGNTYVKQNIYSITDTRRSYERRINQANPSDVNAVWRRATAVWQGSVTTGSVNSLWRDGLYSVLPAVADMPPDWPSNAVGLLRVKEFGGEAGYSHQRLYMSTSSTAYYERVIRYGPSSFPAWQRWGITGGGGGGGATRWTDGKWNVMGDSTTEQPYSYWSHLASPLGIITPRNYGIGGTAIAERPSLPGFESNAMCQRFGDMDLDADLITVLGGTNDWSSNIVLGTMASTDNTTFYGACKTLFGGLVDRYPTSTIAVFTPFPRASMRGVNGNGDTIYDFADVIKDVARWCAIPCCDLLSGSIFKPYNLDNKNALMPDGIHPNETGHLLVSFNQMYGFLNGL